MPRRKVNQKEILERENLAQDFKAFMTRFKFTEVRMGELLNVSRRTIQMIRAGKVNPKQPTLLKFSAIKAKYESEFGKEVEQEEQCLI